MNKGLLHVLKGTFLVSGDAPKNWLFLLFISFLAVVMISSSHVADKRLHEISKLNEEVRALRSEFVRNRKQLQQLRLESTLMETVAITGLRPSDAPPKKIKVKAED